MAHLCAVCSCAGLRSAAQQPASVRRAQLLLLEVSFQQCHHSDALKQRREQSVVRSPRARPMQVTQVIQRTRAPSTGHQSRPGSRRPARAWAGSGRPRAPAPKSSAPPRGAGSSLEGGLEVGGASGRRVSAQPPPPHHPAPPRCTWSPQTRHPAPPAHPPGLWRCSAGSGCSSTFSSATYLLCAGGRWVGGEGRGLQGCKPPFGGGGRAAAGWAGTTPSPHQGARAHVCAWPGRSAGSGSTW